MFSTKNACIIAILFSAIYNELTALRREVYFVTSPLRKDWENKIKSFNNEPKNQLENAVFSIVGKVGPLLFQLSNVCYKCTVICYKCYIFSLTDTIFEAPKQNFFQDLDHVDCHHWGFACGETTK